jgi:hypothetical protein
MARKAADQTESPRISVIDRRLRNPFGTPSREIPLKGDKKGWVVRTFAADPEHPNRHYDAVHRLGWTPLTKDDLAVSIESLGYVEAPDKRVVRGEKGHEVLMAMPKADFDRIQKAKSDANLKALKVGAVKAEVAQATAKEHGDEAGETTYKHFSQQEFVEPIGTVGE